jgi:hypothetical protein
LDDDVADIVPVRRIHAQKTLAAQRFVMAGQQLDTLPSTLVYHGADGRVSATPPQSCKQQMSQSQYSTSPHIQIGDVQLLQNSRGLTAGRLEAMESICRTWQQPEWQEKTARQHGSGGNAFPQWEGSAAVAEAPAAQGNAPECTPLFLLCM